MKPNLPSGKNQRVTLPVYSLVIPAFQEEFIIGKSLDTVADYLNKEKIIDKTEVVVVTADSDDKTAKIVRKKSKLFPHFVFVEPGHRVGKGRDVRAGVLASKGDYIVFTDADLATPIHHFKSAISSLEKGRTDVVIGIRNLGNIHTGVRKFVSLAANTISRLLIAPSISDTQCGFKGFTREAAVHIFGKQTVLGWAFDMEIIYIAKKAGKRINKIHIPDWTENKPEQFQLVGDSNIKAAVKTFSEVIKIRLNSIRGLYR